MNGTSDLITSFEAGLLLNKSARTVQRMAITEENPDGKIPVAQKLPGPNGAYLFRRSDVEAYKVRAVALAIEKGACTNCTSYGVVKFHNGERCPHETAVAS